MRGGVNLTQQYQIAYGGLCNLSTIMDKVDKKLDLALHQIVDAHSRMVDKPGGTGRFTLQERQHLPIDMAVFGPIMDGVRTTKESSGRVIEDLVTMRKGIARMSETADERWKPPAGTPAEPGGCWRGRR